MALRDFSTVIVSGEGSALSQVGFGTCMFATYIPSSVFPELTREFGAVSELTDLGLDDNHPAVLMLQRALGQNPRPTPVKIGRLTSPHTQTVRITPVAGNATVYALEIELVGADPVEVSVTSDGDGTVDEICDLIQAALEDLDDADEPLEGLTVTASGATATHLDLSVAAGASFYIRSWNPARLKIEDRTADPGVAADLDAIRQFDADWYHMATWPISEAFQEEVADWAETQDVLNFGTTIDWQAADSGQTTDLQSVLDGKSYKRTLVSYSEGFDEFPHVGQAAERAPFDPGAPPAAGGDFNGRTVAGVSPTPLTPARKANLLAKGYTICTETSGRVHMLGGDAAGGKPFDQTRHEDWFRFRLQERLAALVLNNGRVPMNKKGLAMYEAECRAQISAGVTSGGISDVDADGNAPSVIMPTLGQIPQNDRAARLLGGPGIQINYAYAGGIRKANVSVFVRL